MAKVICINKTSSQNQTVYDPTCGSSSLLLKIADEMSLAATPVSFNLVGGIYMNQNAAFSDFHVTGGNPSGNASFTNPEYVTKRFTWVGHREPVK